MDSLKYKHSLMPQLPQVKNEGDAASAATQSKYADQVKQLHMHKLGEVNGEKEPQEKAGESEGKSAERVDDDVAEEHGDGVAEEHGDGVVEEHGVGVVEEEEDVSAAEESERGDVVVAEESETGGGDRGGSTGGRQNDSIDRLLYHMSLAVMMAIFAILYRKALQLYT